MFGKICRKTPMKALIQFKTTTPPLLTALLLVCLAFLPGAQATDLDSVLPNGNTADGSGVLVNLTSGVWNSGFGFEALNHDTAGKNNTATGVRALFSDTSGSNNTATGVYALFSNTTGFFNCAAGAFALSLNIDGNFNTANGYGALYRNTADFNTATGFGALFRNTIGSVNTAIGVQALFSNTTGGANTANGFRALFSNTTGSQNTANGVNALFSSTTADFNTANGNAALFSNTTGTNNMANGAKALLVNTTGTNNTANGFQALSSNTSGNNNTANGTDALQFSTTGSENIALGAGAGFNVTTADSVICIGNGGQNVSNSCFIGGIFGQTSSGGTGVFVNSDGKLGTTISSRRFKEEIKPMQRASEVLFALKPVTFRYKKGIDPQGMPQFGLVAEDVEEVNPGLVVRDKDGKVNTVRYEAVNAMLLNEFLKEHRRVKELESTVAQQQKQIEALTSGLQKVSAQLELDKAAPQTVSNK